MSICFDVAVVVIIVVFALFVKQLFGGNADLESKQNIAVSPTGYRLHRKKVCARQKQNDWQDRNEQSNYWR